MDDTKTALLRQVREAFPTATIRTRSGGGVIIWHIQDGNLRGIIRVVTTGNPLNRPVNRVLAYEIEQLEKQWKES